MSELYHYGIQGQKWGVRRYQNEDGSYTREGLKRRLKENGLAGTHAQRSDIKSWSKRQNKLSKKFDAYTEKILQDRKAGLKVSDRRIKKAIKLGTEHRKYDIQARDYKKYQEANQNLSKGAAGAQYGTLLGGPIVGVAVGSIWASTGGKEAMDAGYKYYNDTIDEARDMTISDLKKHGVIQ